MHSKTLLSAAFAAALMGFGAVAQAQSITVRVAPPAPRHEVAPVARAGHVWVRGHYQWRANKYVWVPGRFVTARAGYVYREPQWVQRNGGWVLVGNQWERGATRNDRDGDGVANRNDGDRDGDGIANRQDPRPSVYAPNGDRDSDGVHNSRDRAPTDPRRQ
ncbi:MAG: hypothetical protein ACXW3D_11745 [Caulobacteraceae bacterium]